MAPFCDGDQSPTKTVPLLGGIDTRFYTRHRDSPDLEEAKYNLDDHDPHSSPSCPEVKSPSRKQTAVHVIQIIALFAIGFVLGFIVRQVKTTQPQSRGGLLLGRGFVEHPELAPEPSGVTVFHQLHCLHAIIAAYYTTTEPEADDPLLNTTDTDTQMDPDHVRHCFDYLRQTPEPYSADNPQRVSAISHGLKESEYGPRGAVA
ncbi:hypothetical protein BJY00DRAFT_310160 [Aspergillus carlsbadensis]|nr:hypothetical protein BJY00DRAFT_310160 [Aspergillus carlsbadensis]